MDPFGSVVKPTDAFSESCLKMHKIHYNVKKEAWRYWKLVYRNMYQNAKKKKKVDGLRIKDPSFKVFNETRSVLK